MTPSKEVFGDGDGAAAASPGTLADPAFLDLSMNNLSGPHPGGSVRTREFVFATPILEEVL